MFSARIKPPSWGSLPSRAVIAYVQSLVTFVYDDFSCKRGFSTRLQLRDSGFVVKGFGYWRDPLFQICCALYAINRWVLKPHLHSPFLHFWFNDSLLIPCALPPLLLVYRWFHLRVHDGAPTFLEIASHWALWSVFFEWIGPHIVKHAVGDWWDVVAYLTGAVVAALWWHRDFLRSRLYAPQQF